MTENNFRSLFLSFQINTQLFFIYFFTKWSSAAILDDQKSLLSHFSSFQINTQLYLVQILDDRKSLSIAFLVVSDQYAT